MSTEFAKIPEIKKGIVFSDPMYDETIWCQYRKAFSDTDWLMKLNTHLDEDGILNFELALGRRTLVGRIETKEAEDQNIQISFPNYHEVESTELGIDTARIYCGSWSNWDEAREEAAIYTGGDGFFGELMEFTCKGEGSPAGYLLFGSVDGALMDEAQLCQQFFACFDAEKISELEFQKKTNPNTVEYRMFLANELRHAQASEQNSKKQQGRQDPER